MLCILLTKFSFFRDLSQDMNLGHFPPKEQTSDWLTKLVYQSEALFLIAKQLEFMS